MERYLNCLVDKSDFLQHKSNIQFGNSRIWVRIFDNKKLLQQIPTIAALAYS